jgi:5-methylcytosine-specific restriction endonuclease McrA
MIDINLWIEVENQSKGRWKVCSDGMCFYCFKNYKKELLTIDHFIPKSKQGSDDLNNLVVACFYCNSSKFNRIIKTEKELLEFRNHRSY